MTGSSPGGYALVLVTMVLLLLSILVAVSLHLALQEHHVVAARTAALRARLGAESAVRAALVSWPDAMPEDTVPGEDEPLLAASGSLLGGVGYRATIERLDSRNFLVRGHGWVDGNGRSGASAELAMPVTTLSAEAVHAAFPAALTSPGVVHLRDGAGVTAPEENAHGCPGPDATLRLADAASIVADATSIVTGNPALEIDPELAAPSSFLESAAWFQPVADVVVAGHVRPGPSVRESRCETLDGANWGAPLDPGSPCASYFPVIYAPGSLRVSDGAGQGILIVAGDLHLGAGARFHGAVLVAGRLVAEPGAHVQGALRIAMQADAVLSGATVTFDGCSLANAVAGGGLLSRPLRSGIRSWLPIYR